MKGRDHTFRSMGDIVKASSYLRPPTPTQMRLVDASLAIKNNDPDKEEIAYHHTVFCQTALPYRSVSERVLECNNGHVSLRVEAGTALHPVTKQWVDLPMPFGTKSRLILIHMDTFALSENTQEIDMGNSMTDFLRQLQGYSPNGKELNAFKEHASAVTGALFRFATAKNNHTVQVDTKIVTAFDLWFPKDPDQKVLWPSFARLSDEYYKTLRKHAVPLDQRAIAALQHNALALDIYKWLAQRLCRVEANAPQFIPWPAVQAQYGQSYTRIRDFRDIFRKTLKTVQEAYPRAKVHGTPEGLTLYHSAPPVPKHRALAI